MNKITIDLQLNVPKKKLEEAVLRIAFEELCARGGTSVPSWDAFRLRAAPHFLAADRTTTVAVEHVIVTHQEEEG